MRVSKRTLIITAAMVWYAGGIVLLLKGGSLFRHAYALDANSIWTYAAPLAGVAAGLLKGRFLFSKSCKKNIVRIAALDHPHIWQCFRSGMLIFLFIMVPAGVWMSRAAAGNYTLLCLVGTLDTSISVALLTSSIVFWKQNAFQMSDNERE
jgi:hypothetical protein